MIEMAEPVSQPHDPWLDLQPLLDQELSRLPEKYRVPIVLCDLEGLTYAQIGLVLGVPAGTVKFVAKNSGPDATPMCGASSSCCSRARATGS